MSHRPAIRPVRLLLLVAAAWLVVAAPAGAAIFNSVDGGSDSSCAIRPGGSVFCWGDGHQGQLGVIGATRARTPLAVIGTYTATQVSVGQYFWCALLQDTTVQCTGLGRSGQIGNGGLGIAQYPQPVSGLSGVTTVAAGAAAACAITGGTVWCWGDGHRGEFGDGALRSAPTPTPAQIPGVSGATDVSVGTSVVCAVAGGRVLCWGDTSKGKLGYVNAAAIGLPGTPVTGIEDAVDVAVGTTHACVLRAGGTVWCWGDGPLGQLGDGALDYAPGPVQVSGLSSITSISTRGNTTCALRGDGAVFCWGDGLRGQLGNGAEGRSAVPVQVVGLPGPATSIGVGLHHSCAVLQTLRTYCWGSNQYAQLGDGAIIGNRGGDAVPQLVDDSVKGQAAFIPTPLNERSKTTRGGRFELRQYRLKKVRRSRRCPSYAQITLQARGKTETTRTNDVETVSGGCAVTARILLPRNTERAAAVVFTVRNKQLRTVKHRVKPARA